MSMQIVSCSVLTDEQRAQIEALQNEVYAAENLKNTAWLTNEINYDRNIPCFFLGYEKGVLVSFLTLFLPTQKEGEVVAFTASDCRRKGCFSALLQAARDVLRQYGVPKLLFAVEPQSVHGMQYLKRHFPAAVHSHTEWRMRCTPTVYSLPENITVERVTPDSARDYLSVVLEEYGGNEEAALQRLSSDCRTTFLVRDAGRPVGVFAFAQEEVLTLFGVVIAEPLRGRGYGNFLMQAALSIACEAGKDVELDVDSENPPAVHLYRKYGFTPVFEVQYWRTENE